MLATPPATPTRPNPNAEFRRSPPGLENQEYPNLKSDVPTRHEEKTIAQRNLVIARKNARCIFGQELEVVPNSSRVVRSAQNLDTDMESTLASA